MTVKGMHFNHFKATAGMEEQLSPTKHNGINNGPTTRDSNLNHYKLNQVTFVKSNFY